MMRDDQPRLLKHVYQQACLAEVEAIKPGNVHVFADGHGMQVQDFIESAEVSAIAISQADLSLGERIYQGVAATWEAVACNTNLGIILLCAPIIQCRLQYAEQPLQTHLPKMLKSTTVTDAEWLFKAILRANPAGLGQSDTHDVHGPARASLLTVMEAAASRDLIALQYSNGFFNILTEGVPHYQAAVKRLDNAAWAVTEVYLYWLSHHLDSHIVRKHGVAQAEQVQSEAKVHYEAYQQRTNPKLYLKALLTFDAQLKATGINPGTSADLTVATLLAHAVI